MLISFGVPCWGFYSTCTCQTRVFSTLEHTLEIGTGITIPYREAEWAFLHKFDLCIVLILGRKAVSLQYGKLPVTLRLAIYVRLRVQWMSQCGN